MMMIIIDEKEFETLILEMSICSQGIGIDFTIEKCAMLRGKSEKYQMTEGKECQNHENQNAWRKGNLQVLGNIGSVNHQTKRHERKNFKRITQEKKKTPRNQTILHNSYKKDSPLARYSGPFLKWKKEKLQRMGLGTRKLMMMHKALHFRDDIDSLCYSGDFWLVTAPMKDWTLAGPAICSCCVLDPDKRIANHQINQIWSFKEK